MPWDYTTIPQTAWYEDRYRQYNETCTLVWQYYAYMMSVRNMIEVWLGESSSIRMKDFAYSNSVHKNVCLLVDRGQNQNVYNGLSYNAFSFVENQNYNEGITNITNYFTNYTNSNGGADAYWRYRGIAVVNKVNIEAFIRAVGDKSEAGYFVKNLQEYDGKIGGEWVVS